MASEASPSQLLLPKQAEEEDEEEEEEEEEEYIDIDVSSSTFLCYTFASPPLPDDFEFCLSSIQPDKVDSAMASPADELFYKGKLLPLLLPSRLQMLERLLHNHSDVESKLCTDDESFNLSSPFTSCYVSGELTHEEFMHPLPKKRWLKKLKFIKSYKLGLKLKASGSYIKSLFARSHGLLRGKRMAAASIGSDGGEKVVGGSGKEQENNNGQRRSISGAITRYLPAVKNLQCSSSSSCSSSPPSTSGCSSERSKDGGLPASRRRGSAGSEEEESIQRAIAYCKSSQQAAPARKSLGDVRCGLLLDGGDASRNNGVPRDGTDC